MTYDIQQEALAKADDATKAKLKNLSSVGMLKGLVAEAELRVKYFETILRIMDFLGGMENELTQDLVQAGVLAERKQEAVKADVPAV